MSLGAKGKREISSRRLTAGVMEVHKGRAGQATKVIGGFLIGCNGFDHEPELMSRAVTHWLSVSHDSIAAIDEEVHLTVSARPVAYDTAGVIQTFIQLGNHDRVAHPGNADRAITVADSALKFDTVTLHRPRSGFRLP